MRSLMDLASGSSSSSSRAGPSSSSGSGLGSGSGFDLRQNSGFNRERDSRGGAVGGGQRSGQFWDQMNKTSYSENRRRFR